MESYVLELYITGNSVRSEVAIKNLQKICTEYLKGHYELRVIDVLESPDLAERSKVLATPTLIKSIPPPVKRLIGDFTDIDKLKFHLDL